MNGVVVSLKGVAACAGNRNILDDVNLTLRQGERVALVGPNGAGKSTLLKLLTGLADPSGGEVTVLGRALHRHVPKRALRELRVEVGQVFQGLHLVHRLSALENVLLGSLARNRTFLSWARLFPETEVARAEAALQAVGMLGKAQMRADRLSGGERQKIAIARVVMQAPRLILADEPTAALDPRAATDMAGLLSSLAVQHAMTMLTVVHDPGLLPLLARRVIGMRDGAIVFDLPVDAVDEGCLARLYRRHANGSDGAPLPARPLSLQGETI